MSQFKTLLLHRLTLPVLFLVETAEARSNEKLAVLLVEEKELFKVPSPSSLLWTTNLASLSP